MPKNNLTFDEQSHRYFLDGNFIPSVTQIIDSVFPFEGHGLAAERSADFGKAVHKAIELDIQGRLNWATVDDAILPYIKQWEKIYSHLNILTVRCQVETMLVSKKYKFAGRVDLIHEGLVIDIKTGQKKPTHLIQIAAYKHLVSKTLKVKVEKALLVYLNGSDEMPEIVKGRSQDFATFLACLEIYNWRNSNG